MLKVRFLAEVSRSSPPPSEQQLAGSCQAERALPALPTPVLAKGWSRGEMLEKNTSHLSQESSGRKVDRSWGVSAAFLVFRMCGSARAGSLAKLSANTLVGHANVSVESSSFMVW